jgi:hypothetical protein
MRIRFRIWACLLGLLAVAGCKKDLSPRYYADGEVRVLMKNNPDGPNIVFLGDGFIREDLEVGGLYDRKVKEMTDHLFSVPPFNRYKKNFNVYQVYAQSSRRGARDGIDFNDTSTKFNSYFPPGNRTVYMAGYENAIKYIQKAIPMQEANLPVVLVNDHRYGGTGSSIAVVSLSEYAKSTFVHEAGHTFAFLGDEYVEEGVNSGADLSSVVQYPNLDSTSKPALIKWKHYYNRPRYAGIVGAFEGGYYRAKGVYRPEENSVMRNNLTTRNFNAPSREAIVRRIYEIMGKPFDLDAYLKEDMNTMGYALQPETGPHTNLPPLTADHIKPLEQLKMMQLQRQYREQHNRVN